MARKKQETTEGVQETEFKAGLYKFKADLKGPDGKDYKAGDTVQLDAMNAYKFRDSVELV